jgi:nitrate reductase NapA
MTVDRRTFLKGMAAASAITAGSVVAPGVLRPVGADQLRESEPDTDWQKTPCSMCGVTCGLLVAIEGGRAAAVKGDPASPVNKGLACARGYYSVQALYGRDRITSAMVRRNRSMVPVQIGEALDLVTARIRDTIQRHGRNSVAIYGSERWTIQDAYVASKLFKGGLGTNNVETSARLHAASARAGLESSFGLGGALGSYDDVDHADVFVLWDINLAETDPVLFSRMLDRRRRDRAVRIVDLATRTTRTSYASDRSLLHSPHSGLAIANAICHELVARNRVDRAFIERHVAFKRGRTGIGYGLNDDALLVDEPTSASWDDFVAFLAPYTPERAQRLSGLSADGIRWLASLYGERSRKLMTVWGAGANQHARGTWLNNLLYNIHLLAGKVASPGNSPLCLTGEPGGGDFVSDAGSLTHTLPRGAVASEEDRGRAATIWGVPAERIDPRPAGAAVSMFRALDRGDIRFLWIQGANPMVDLPGLSRYRSAAAKEDRFVVVSEAYPTPTTDLADVVLPAALWIEREGVVASVERRAQHFDQLVASPGDAMSEAWQMIEVARRLGLSRLFPWERSTHAAQIWEEYRRFHDDSRTALPPLAALRAQAGAIWPYVNGRETRWRYNTAHDPAADRARGEFDFYGHPDGRAWIWLRPHEPPAESPDRAYPFWLRTGAVLEHSGTGTLTRRIPTLHRSVPRAYVEINREDANRLGVRNRETVRLVSRRGSVEIEARIDYRSRPPRGQLFVPDFDEGTPVGRLMLDAFCPLSGQPDVGTCAVRVERTSGRSSA